MQKFSDNLKLARKMRNLTQRNISDELMISVTTYRNYEHGRAEPKITRLIHLSKLLEVSVDFLLGIDNENRFYSPNRFSSTFTIRLKELRKSLGYTQKSFANLLCIKQTRYESYEHGAREPSNMMLIELSKIFNVSLNYLLGQESSEKEESKCARLRRDLN